MNGVLSSWSGAPRRGLRYKVLVALALVTGAAPGTAIAVAHAPAHQTRGLSECVRDLAGAGQYGGLSYDTEFFLSLQSINESEWTGNHDYGARRYDSGFNVTFFQIETVDLGAPQELTYGTAGNANRRTTIETENQVSGLPNWSEMEDAIC